MAINIIGYQIEREIAKGSKSLIFRALRNSDQKKVVIKLHRGDFVNDSLKRNLEQETKLANLLDHPGIVKSLLDLDTSFPLFYVVGVVLRSLIMPQRKKADRLRAVCHRLILLRLSDAASEKPLHDVTLQDESADDAGYDAHHRQNRKPPPLYTSIGYL